MDDVIVVGAGPAGNNAALGLATQGYSVTVFDWRQSIGEKLCTGLVGRECIRRFPIDRALVHRELRSAQVTAPGGSVVRFETPAPQACVVDRVAYVASFAARAREAGAQYQLGKRVHRIIPEKWGVTVVTDQGSRRSRALVLAAGFGSPLTRQAGLGSVADHVTGAQAVVSTDGVDEVEVYLGQDVAPGFFSWLVPTLPGRALVGLLSRRRAQAHLAGFIQRLQVTGKVREIVAEPTCWGIPLRPLQRTFRDRLLVVGDAAGQVKPTTGGGIYYSLLASEIASQVLGQALGDGDLSSARLSQYQARWRELLAGELEVGYSARRLYEFLTDQQIGALVRRAGANVVQKDVVDSSDVPFDWHSRLIARVMVNPALGGALRLINPVLSRLAWHPGAGPDSSPTTPGYRIPPVNVGP